MSGLESSLLTKLRRDNDADETDLLNRIANGLEHDEYMKLCGQIRQVRKARGQLNEIIQKLNSGADDAGD